MATVSFNQAAGPTPGAVAYACTRAGWRVFPLVPGVGLPALSGWPQAATRDVERVREWWTGTYAGYGVGIATGAGSGIWVLDVDMKHGSDGFASLRDVTYANGETGIALRRTFVVGTPSGGAHLYFTWCSGVVNSAGRLGAGLDVRGEGGYVRAPGLGGYAIRSGDLICVRSAPEWLCELAQARKIDHESAALRAQRPGTTWSAYQLTRTLTQLREARVGTRNDALNLAAYRLGLSGAVGEAEAWKACWVIMHVIGGGDERRERRTFESGWRSGVRDRPVT